MRKPVVIVIIVVVLLVIAVGVALLIHSIKNSIMDGPDMEYKNPIIGCSYNYGGGMLGGNYNVSLRLSEDGSTAKLSISENETWEDPVSSREYTVPATALDEIEKVVEQYHLIGLDVDKLTKYEILDGDTESIRIDFEKGKGIYFGEVELPEKSRGVQKALLDCMLSFAENEKIDK